MTIVRVRFQPGLKPIIEKHQQHDQQSHGNWAGTKSELSDDDYRDIVYNAKTVEQAYTTIAKRLGKNMKAKEAELSEDEINVYRGVTNVERDTKRLLDGKIRFQEFQTWGQGIYVDPTKERASDYGTVLSLKLDKNAKILKGEAKWSEAVDVKWQNENAKVPGTWSSDFVDMNRIKMNINDMGYPSYSVSDLKNLYWASKGYDGFSPHGGEMVLFNGGVLTLNKNTIKKHQQHDQQSHGNWATGGYSKIGGPGVDITKKLDEIFADPETTLDLQNRLQAQVDAGQKGSDVALDLIIKLQGFDGKPKTTKTLKDLDELEKSGEYVTVYRGVTDFSSEAYNSGKGDENSKISQTSQQSINDFTEGEYFSGQGLAGSGTYTSSSKDRADSYAANVDESDGVFNNGKVMKILVPKNIKMPSPEVVRKVTEEVSNFWSKKFDEGANEVPPNHENNIGRKLASLGYQAYRVTGVRAANAQDFENDIIILDRSSVVVSKEPITNYEGLQ